MSGNDPARSGFLPPGQRPEEAAFACAARGDITAAAICRVVAFYESVLEEGGWDAPPHLWYIERLAVSPGDVTVAGCGGWALPGAGAAELAGGLQGMAVAMSGPAFPATAAARCDLVAWLLAHEARYGPARTQLRIATAADRAGVRYQLYRPRGGEPVMLVADGSNGDRILGPVPDAVAELAAAWPAPAIT